jgi:hypothetical protein
MIKLLQIVYIICFSILHYIWLCPVVKLFWNQVKTWLEEIFDISFELNMANIVFITRILYPNLDSIIWYNSSLKIEGKTIFYKELFDNNIIFIKDILDEENKFKTYDELKNQFNCKVNFLKYFNLISMIKSKNVTKITLFEFLM